MIAQLEVVTGMELPPQACVLCSNNPVDENTGEQQPAIFAPGVDIDWGSSVYICASCVNIMADLFDRVDHDTHKKVVEKLETLEDKYEHLSDDHERAKALLERIKDGKAAIREARAEPKPGKKKVKA